MARLATIPEMVDHILEYSDGETLGRSAQVCRLWNPIAKRHLWANLSSLVPLLVYLQAQKGRVSAPLSTLR